MNSLQSQSEGASIPCADSQEADHIQKRSVWRRFILAFATTMAVTASLLCFPKWLPWMVAFWLGWQTWLIVRGRNVFFPVLTCLILLVIRLSPPTPFMLVLACAVLATAVSLFRGQKLGGQRLGGQRKRGMAASKSITSRLPRLLLALLWVAWALMTWEYRSGERGIRQSEFDLTRPIVCIGDSLTQGLIPDRGYPGKLETMVKFPVVNQGVSGVATGPAVGILERAMELNPQVVIIELGGHDFLKWHSRSSTKANLSRMIEICRKHETDVILMEIPRGFMVDPYAGLERELAYWHDLELVDDRWLRHVVLMSPIAPPGRWMDQATHLSDDGIHSNEKGSLHIAKFVRKALVNLYGKRVLTNSAEP